MPDKAGAHRWIKADLGPKDVAHYIADAVSDLLPLARQAAFRDLAYLLDLALAEAEYLANQPTDRPT